MAVRAPRAKWRCRCRSRDRASELISPEMADMAAVKITPRSRPTKPARK